MGQSLVEKCWQRPIAGLKNQQGDIARDLPEAQADASLLQSVGTKGDKDILPYEEIGKSSSEVFLIL
jgi:hypothetical protein